MSLRWAAAMIQAAPFAGTPRVGQEARAAANASCMASSARSKEPEIRIKPARIRPDSCRNTASAAERMSTISSDGVIRRGLGFARRRYARQRSNLDAPRAALARRRNPRGPLDRLVQVPAIQNVITGELLLGFGERAVSDQCLAVFHAHGGRSGRRRKRLGRDEDALAGGLLHQGPMAVIVALGHVPARAAGLL